MAYKHEESVLRLMVVAVFVPVDEYTQECQAATGTRNLHTHLSIELEGARRDAGRVRAVYPASARPDYDLIFTDAVRRLSQHVFFVLCQRQSFVGQG